jgi:uroporphyrinogen decarboxylase
MDSRTRVARALSHTEPDRVPIDYWASPEVTAKLLHRFGFPSKEALLQHFGVDLRYIDGPAYIGPETVVRADGLKEDHFGVPRRRVSYGEGDQKGTYSEVAAFPLEGATSVEEVERYPKWPSADWFDYEPVREQARRARELGKTVVFMGDRLNRCAQLKPAMYLRGVDQILMDLYMNPDIARAIFRRITAFYCEYMRRTLEAAQGNIDIVFTGDDFGTQQNTFMSNETWREMLGEGFRCFIDIGHEFGCKVAHHTCGSIVGLIPEFISCGLDILNSLQPDVQGMDYERIKAEFGRHIAFHGGISIQKTLPYGTAEDVRNEVRDRIAKLADRGGYILCTAHNIQTDTPLENIEALFQAYAEFGVRSGS